MSPVDVHHFSFVQAGFGTGDGIALEARSARPGSQGGWRLAFRHLVVRLRHAVQLQGGQ